MKTKTWFGVKTLYRFYLMPLGRHKKREPDLIEERVVLVHETTAERAILRAERDAIEYASTKATNRWGQQIKGEYLGCCDCFKLFDSPGHLVEVFSSTELISRNRTNKQVENARFGRRRVNENGLRRLFADREFEDVPSLKDRSRLQDGRQK